MPDHNGNAVNSKVVRRLACNNRFLSKTHLRLLPWTWLGVTLCVNQRPGLWEMGAKQPESLSVGHYPSSARYGQINSSWLNVLKTNVNASLHERHNMESPAPDPSITEQRKIEIDEKKIEIEFAKIRIEKLRAWTGSSSTFASLVVVAATIGLGIWSQYEQAKLQHDIQDRQAKAQFELKAAEIVMSTDNPGTTFNKAKALQSLFPQYLSGNFAESFVPQSFSRPAEVVFTTNTNAPRRNQTNAARPGVNTKQAPSPEQVFTFNTERKLAYRSGLFETKRQHRRQRRLQVRWWNHAKINQSSSWS